MSTWIVLTAANLYPFLMTPQMTVLRDGLKDAGESDPFDTIMPFMAARVRGAIGANPRNTLSLTPNSIPPECAWILVWLVLEQMQTRIAGFALTDDQKAQITKAEKTLEKIAQMDKQQMPVSQPIDPETTRSVQVLPTTEALYTITRLATRESLSAL
jgi:hypothetical protein